MDASPKWTMCWWRIAWSSLFFFFQAEAGIRDVAVTGVQTCALPISRCRERDAREPERRVFGAHARRVVGRRLIETAMDQHDFEIDAGEIQPAHGGGCSLRDPPHPGPTAHLAPVPDHHTKRPEARAPEPLAT